MLKRKSTLAMIGLALATTALIRHPTADIRIMTHDAADPSPRHFQAAVDLGIVAVKLLITWTAGRLADH